VHGNDKYVYVAGSALNASDSDKCMYQIKMPSEKDKDKDNRPAEGQKKPIDFERLKI
jgi:hypothetical protein